MALHGESGVLGLLTDIVWETKANIHKDTWGHLGPDCAGFMAPHCSRVLVILQLSSVILPSSKICVPLVKFDYFPCSLSQSLSNHKKPPVACAPRFYLADGTFSKGGRVAK